MQSIRMEYIPINKIEVNWDFRSEPRDKEISDGIKQSIKETGLVQLIKVRPVKNGKYEVVAGRGRLQQLKGLGEKSIPVIIEDLTEEQAKLQSIIENIQRQNISPMEMANAFEKLLLNSGPPLNKQKGYAWISNVTGMSLKRISQIMSLVEASEPIKKKIETAVKKKQISEDVAVEILSATKDKPKIRERALDKAIKMGVNKDKIGGRTARQIVKSEKDNMNFEEALKSLKSAGIIDENGIRKKTPDDFVHELMDKVLCLYYWLEPKVIPYLTSENVKRLRKELTDLKEDRIEPFLEELETNSL